MTNKETYRHYLRDLIFLIKERRSEILVSKQEDEFSKGLEFGYLSVLDLIENQAESFQIELSDIGFSDYEKFNQKS